MSRVLVPAAAALLLAACATTPTVYGPAATPTASGYSEMKIQSDRYRITFRGGSNASAQHVRDLALRYAADVTLREGYDWFRVTGSYTDAIGGGGPTIGIGIGGASYGRSSAVGVGGDVGFPVGGGPRVAETLEVVLGRGSLPEGGDAYDAREVRESLAVPPPTN